MAGNRTDYSIRKPVGVNQRATVDAARNQQDRRRWFQDRSTNPTRSDRYQPRHRNGGKDDRCGGVKLTPSGRDEELPFRSDRAN